MSISVEAAGSFEATITGAPPGLVGTFARHIQDGQGVTVWPTDPEADGVVTDSDGDLWSTAGIVEHPASTYTATQVAPEELGQYGFAWWNGTNPVGSSNSTTEDLTVTAALTGADFAPTVQEVADIVAAYVREHVGGYQRVSGDQVQAGRERATFTADTDPTVTQVEAYIALAVAEIRGRVGAAIPDERAELARTAAIWHAAASVVAKRRPSQTEDGDSLYRAFITNYRFSLDALIAFVRAAFMFASVQVMSPTYDESWDGE